MVPCWKLNQSIVVLRQKVSEKNASCLAALVQPHHFVTVSAGTQLAEGAPPIR
jgi:hypothetical protein